MPSALEWLQSLVRIPSYAPGGDERPLGALIRDALARAKPDAVELIEVERPEGPSVYVWARFGEPRLLVNAHLDTVPPSSGWSSNPCEPHIANGHLFGLGASDIKGAIAAALSALERERPQDTAFLFSGDEERSGACMQAFLASGRGRGIERAIVCEPTGLRAGARHRGILALSVRREGEGGHSSRADHMVAPVAELAEVGAALADWGRQRRNQGPPGFQGMCLNLASLEGGVAFNVVPKEATLTLSLRPPPGPGIDQKAIFEELSELSRKTVPCEVRLLIDNAPFATRDLSAFAPLIGARTAAPIDLGFWTEAAMLSATGIDAVVIGPGEISQAHAPNERLALTELEAAAQLFEEIFAATRTQR
jgi:acetylornithine deacetylase